MVGAADGVAVNASDRRLQAALGVGMRIDGRSARLALALDFLEPAHVSARAKGAVSGAGDDHHTDLWIAGGSFDGVSHLSQRMAGEGVHHLGAVDGDPGGAADAVVLLVEDVCKVGHRFSPLSRLVAIIAWRMLSPQASWPRHA